MSGGIELGVPSSSAAAAGAPQMIAADMIAPAITTPVDADMTNVECILCVIGILHVSFRRDQSA
jgi:hypothetical protein